MLPPSSVVPWPKANLLRRVQKDHDTRQEEFLGCRFHGVLKRARFDRLETVADAVPLIEHTAAATIASIRDVIISPGHVGELVGYLEY